MGLQRMWASNGRGRLRSRRVERDSHSLTPFRPCAVLVYGAPLPALRTGLRDGGEAKVRAAAASRGRPSAGAESQLLSIYLSISTYQSIYLAIIYLAIIYLVIYPS